jgi:glutathione gamma-glutamylcysteinyltransferase
MILKGCRPMVSSGNFAILRRFFGAENYKKGCAKEVNEIYRKNTCLAVEGCGKEVKDLIIKSEPMTTESFSFHGRILPDHLTSLESPRGQEIFHESFTSGHATNFFSLITNFASQSDVSMCGPASLAMVLNALKLDPMRTWRRPWRWWSDEMFACCDGSLEVMKKRGVTLEFFDRIAKKQKGISVETRGPGSLEEFRNILKQSAKQYDCHVIVSFGRESLGQTGIGHFSPVAAVHESKDLALVLDVARFKYPPYWVKIDELHMAMLGADPETGMSRGYSVIKKLQIIE